jgi:hypothetical protein
MTTVPTIESYHALGVMHGTGIARRLIGEMLRASIEGGEKRTDADRDALTKAQSQEEHQDCTSQQTELAMRGATLPALEAYTDGRREAYAAEFAAFTKRLAALETDAPVVPNRAAKRKAAALAKKAKP